ncbi:hypothetical protein MNBD_GAMMA02-1196 [hydrothermal vent metagenome]|uniref:Uncharacterized protein n=1 Tax=hydrothermal vent metagenome TaxID=652676 RepID=A0A3B0W2Q2_9ZZZZ
MKKLLLIVISTWVFQPATAVNLGSEFTYQGQLKSAGSVANGPYDFEFYLYNVQTNGSDLAANVADDVQVEDGVFSVELDMGAAFIGDQLWLEIHVRDGASNGSYTALQPRQKITAAPYAQGLMPGTVVEGSGNIAMVSGINTASSGGRGLFGQMTHTSAGGQGVRGESNSTSSSAIGTFGILTNASASGAGIKGQNNGTTGYGVWGQGGGNATGVLGQTNSSNDSGVWAYNSGSGTALRTEGNGNLIESWDLAPVNLRFRVDNNGNVSADGSYTSPAADFAEMLPARSGLEAADVLVFGPDGKLALSTKAYQRTLAGVYSTKPAFIGGVQSNATDIGKIPLAVVGIIPVKVTDENGEVKPGDMLTSSNTAGFAMRAGLDAPNGTVIGKALGSMNEDQGIIKMFAILQ